ncbi:MAG: FAD-dependent oxidoreductase [Candidatus Hermodarchaeota archaeon]
MTLSKSRTRAVKGKWSENALVVGGGVAGMQAALDIADQNYKVYLLEKSSSIGGRMAMIDKTFPTLDCSACILTPRLSEVQHHPNIDLLTYSEVQEVKGSAGAFKVKVLRKARYVDEEKCNGCGDCVSDCPIEVPNEFDQGIGFRKAIYIPFPQATPNTHTIDKRGHAPCYTNCPAHVNPQGFTALMRRGENEKALRLVRDAIPFPGSLGRVCPALCEEKCERSSVDDPVSIRNLHRWLYDNEREQGVYKVDAPVIDKKDRVAVIGAGPAGIACAEKLARLGYPVTIFEKREEAGGLLRYGIPAHRLPRDVLANEIKIVEDMGVKILYGKEITSIKSLLNKGFKAVFLGTGAPISSKLRIKNEDSNGVYHAIDFLDRVNRGEKVRLGYNVAVIGGGNAAIDAARVAKRLGVKNVTIIYRRSRAEMPAIHSEIDDALEEGIELKVLTNPVECIESKGRLVGVTCIEMKLGEPDDSGRRRPIPIPGSEFSIPFENMVIAIGQRADPKGPHAELEVTEWGTPVVDPVTLQTSMENVFAGGDLATGPGLVVEAVGQGNAAAESIHRFLQGEDLKSGRPETFLEFASDDVRKARFGVHPRAPMPKISIYNRRTTFKEVETGFDAETAIFEAGRCLNCTVCSECMECVEACQREAIDHSQKDEIIELEVGAIVMSTGYKLFDVKEYPRLGYETHPNVITAMEYERLINAAGPTAGHLVRLSDGKAPESIGFINCVGARDLNKGVPNCSRVCCMYSIKNAVMAKEHDPDVDVTVYYADIRAFGKGFEEFLEMAKTRFGVKFIRGRVAEVVETEDEKAIVRVEDTEDLKFLQNKHDLIVLSGGIQPSQGMQILADDIGIELDNDGYVKVEHPLLYPVDADVDGIYTCGCSDGPKDIPDSVAAGSAAAMRATIVLSRGGEVK